MERRWSVPIISALVALLAVVLVAPGQGPAEGAIPNKGGTYSACLVKKTGAVKVINYPKVKCAKGQRLIRWNATGQQGAQGAQGPAGPADWNAIPNKPAGFADGVDNAGVTGVKLSRVNGLTQDVPGSGGSFPLAADCPAGSRVTGGGVFTPSINVRMVSSVPEDSDTWLVQVFNTAGTTSTATPYAICMSVEPTGALSVAKKGSISPAKLKKRNRNRR